MMPSKRSVLFDFDGTIANSFPIVLRIANDLAAKHGFQKLEKEEIDSLREKSARDVFKTLKIPFYKLPFLIGSFTSELHKQIAFLKPVEGMIEVLKKLHEDGYLLAIITSNTEENVRAFLKKYSVEDCFTFLHCGGSIFGKARFLTQFLNDYSIDKSSAIYVGDEVRDIDTAREAEVRVISVSWGYNSRSILHANHPDALVDTPDDLFKEIDEVVF